jgi:ethanolamine utilization microcompartment shell protein EutL
MAETALWNGDICDLEVDANVSPASTSLPTMAEGTRDAVAAAYDAFRMALTAAAARPTGMPA